MPGPDELRVLRAIRERLAEIPDPMALLERLFAFAPVALQIYRADGHCVLTNHAFRELFGAEPPPGYDVFRDEVLRERGILGHLRRAFAGETVRVPAIWYDARQLRHVHVAEGRRIAIGSTCFPLRDADGAVAFVALVFEDITQELEKDALYAESLRTERALEKASRAKDEFLAMLGHELRNPLAPIVTALDLMRLRGGDAFAEERAVIRRQVEHLTRLVDDLLDVSRITSGKIELRRRAVELATIVARAVETTSPLFERAGHRLTTAVPAAGLGVDGDETRLVQVVTNLLANAATYTPPGGRIDVEARRAGPAVELRVRDDGAGIAADLLPHVFDLFVQGARTIDRPQGGLGLGLAIARNVIDLHGGSIAAASAGPGLGSEFVVRLPACAPPDPAAETPSPPPARAGAARRVLVVDDNADAALGIAAWLETLGHVVHVAYDGPGALAIAEAAPPEVALLDIGLPLMDGYELAARLRALPGLASVRLVAITGYGQAGDRARSAAAGFDAHLVKPVALDEVAALLARAAW